MAGMGEVDTSSQFDSVKQAVNRFGGGGVVLVPSGVVARRHNVAPFQLRPEEIELMKVEEETAKVEMELFAKERETFKVLKELEATKHRMNALNSQVEKETKPFPFQINEEKFPVFLNLYREIFPQNSKKSPKSTLMDLQQAKNNLNKSTIEILKSKIEEEKKLMENTREKIQVKNAKVGCLEQDLNKLYLEIEIKKSNTQSDIQARIKQAITEEERSQNMAKNYKSEISRLIFEIEQTKSKTKTTEVRYLMANKMKESSNSAEKLALSKIQTLNSNSGITLSVEDHAELIYKVQEADKVSQIKIETANKEVEDAKKSAKDLLERVEEAMVDVETSRNALNAALKREEVANKYKLEVEEALRRWRSSYHNTPNNKKNFHNSTKFKHSVMTPKRGLLDVNGLSLVKSGSTLSIGQILDIKLLGPEERLKKSDVKSSRKPKVSLGQILSQSYESYSPFKIDDGTCQSKLPSKRKKLGLVVFALVMAKQRRKKKKQGFNPQSNFCSKVM